MPKAVSEISTGNQFQRTLEPGRLADSAIRVFRVILNTPAEAFNIQATCGVFIGDIHPTNPNIACVSFDAKFDGDSRTVLLATFNYQSAPASTGGGGGGGLPPPTVIQPNIRPANWSISTETVEEPLREWRRRISATQWQGDTDSPPNPLGAWGKPLNPAGDMYEGLTGLRPATSIKVSQFFGIDDPTYACEHVGKINSDTIILNSLTIKPHELMLRSINSTPAVEPWGNAVYRGWNVEFTFLYKKQIAPVHFDQDGGEWGIDENVEIGWDIAVVVEGRNVVCFNPAAGDPWEDPYGQPLKKGDDDVILDPNNLSLPDGVAVGDRFPACVRIAGFSSRGATQAIASQPIALNADGTPRLIVPGTREPIIWAYQIYRDIPMASTLRLRLT